MYCVRVCMFSRSHWRVITFAVFDVCARVIRTWEEGVEDFTRGKLVYLKLVYLKLVYLTREHRLRAPRVRAFGLRLFA